MMTLLCRVVLLYVLTAPIYSQFNMFPPGGFSFPGSPHVPMPGFNPERMAAINRRLNTGFLATPQGRRLPMAVRIDLAAESGNIASEAAEIAQELGINLNAPVPPAQRPGMGNPPGFFPGFGNPFFSEGHPPTHNTGVGLPSRGAGTSSGNHGFGIPYFPYFGPPTTPSPERAGQLAEMEAERLEQLEGLATDPPPETTTAAPVTVKLVLPQDPRMSNVGLHLSVVDVGAGSRGHFTASQLRAAAQPIYQSSLFSSIGGSPVTGPAIRVIDFPEPKISASGNPTIGTQSIPHTALPKINGNPLYNRFDTTVINSRSSARINKPDPRIMIAAPPASVSRTVLNPAGASLDKTPVVKQGFVPQAAPAIQWGIGAGFYNPPVATPTARRPSPPLAQYMKSLSSFPNIPDFGATFVVDPTFKTIIQAPVSSPTPMQPDVIVAEATFKSPPAINGFPSYGSTLNIINRKQPVYESVPGPGDIQMQGMTAVTPTAVTKLKKHFVLGGNPEFSSNLDIIQGKFAINPPLPTVSTPELAEYAGSATTGIIPDSFSTKYSPIASILSSRFAPVAGLAASLADVLSTEPGSNARPSDVTPLIGVGGSMSAVERFVKMQIGERPSAALNVRKPIVTAVPITPLTIISNNRNNVPSINAEMQSSWQVVTKEASPPQAKPGSVVLPPALSYVPLAINQAHIIDHVIPMNTPVDNIHLPPVNGNNMQFAPPLWPGDAASVDSAGAAPFNRPGATAFGMLSGAGGMMPTGQDWAHYYGLLAAMETRQGSFAKTINEPEIVMPSEQLILSTKTLQTSDQSIIKRQKVKNATSKEAALLTPKVSVDPKPGSFADSLAASTLTNYPNIESAVVWGKSQTGTRIDSTNVYETSMIAEGIDGALTDSIIKPDRGAAQAPAVRQMIVSQSMEGDINGANVNRPMVKLQQVKIPDEPTQRAFKTKSGAMASNNVYLYPTKGPNVEHMAPSSRRPVPSKVSTPQMESSNDGSPASTSTSNADTLTHNVLPSGLTDFNMQQLLIAAQLAMARQQTNADKQIPTDSLFMRTGSVAESNFPTLGKVTNGLQSSDRRTNILRETNAKITSSVTNKGLLVNNQPYVTNLNTSESEITQEELPAGLRNPVLTTLQSGTMPQVLSTPDSSVVMATQNGDAALSAIENIGYPFDVLTNNRIASIIFSYNPPQMTSDNTYQDTGLNVQMGPIIGTGPPEMLESDVPIAADQHSVDMVSVLPYQTSTNLQKSISTEPQNIPRLQINAVKINKVMATVKMQTSSGGEAASNGEVKLDQAQASQNNEAVETTNRQNSGFGPMSLVNSESERATNTDPMQATHGNSPLQKSRFSETNNEASTVGEPVIPDNTADIINGFMLGFRTMVPASIIEPVSMDMASETNFVPAQRSMDTGTGETNGRAPVYVLEHVSNSIGIANGMEPSLEINPDVTPTLVSNMPYMINEFGPDLSPAISGDAADNTMGVDSSFGSLSTGTVPVMKNNMMSIRLAATANNAERTVDMASVLLNSFQGSFTGAVPGADGSQAGIPGTAWETTRNIIDGDTMTIPTHAAPIGASQASPRGNPVGFAAKTPGGNVPVANAEVQLPSEATSLNDGTRVNVRNDMLGLSTVGLAKTEQGSISRGEILSAGIELSPVIHVDEANSPIGFEQVMVLQNSMSPQSVSVKVNENGVPSNTDSVIGDIPENLATISGVRVSGMQNLADLVVDTVSYSAKFPTVIPDSTGKVAIDLDRVNSVSATRDAALAYSIYYGLGGALDAAGVVGIEASPTTSNVAHIGLLRDAQPSLALSPLGNQLGIQQGMQTRATGSAQFQSIPSNGNIDAMSSLFGTGPTDSIPFQNMPGIENIDATSSLFGANTPAVAGTASFPRLSDSSSFLPLDRSEPAASMPASSSSLFGDLTVSTITDTTRVSPNRQPAAVFPVGNLGNRNTQGGQRPTEPSSLPENNRRNLANAGTCAAEGLFEDETSCSGYIECRSVRGRLEPVVRQCPFAQFWDREVGRCGPATQIVCGVDHCQNMHLSSYGQAGNCRAYWRCDNSHSWPSCCRRGTRYVPGVGCRASTSCQDQCSTEMPDTTGTNDILKKLLLLWHLAQ